jgi:serine/threonine protein kinase
MNVLLDFTLGLMPEDESQSIEDHLHECNACTQIISESDASDALVETLRERSLLVISEDAEIASLRQKLHSSYSKITHHLSTNVPGDETQVNAPRTPESNTLPETIGHYRLHEKLGEGGTGIVFRAWDQQLQRSVALKIILDRRLWNTNSADRFKSEAAMLAQIQHPQIVQIFEIGEEAGRPFLALEYLAGGDLASLLRNQPQHFEDSARLLMQLAQAVHHAHQQGIIHRDLKPSNILMAQPPDKNKPGKDRPLQNLEIKIADFGLAKRMEVDGITETGVVLGTPGYMAPESLKQRPEQHAPTMDVYSLGAILYELLTGRPPFRGETIAETLIQVQTSIPLAPSKLRPRLPRDLETICLHCLDKDPARRYRSADELANDLERYLEKRPILVRPAGPIVKLMSWARRKPALASLTALLALALIALLAGTIRYERRLQSELNETQVERDRASLNYRQARESLERMLAKLDEPHRANIPQLQALRREQQRELLKFMQTVTSTTSDDPAVMRDVARAYYTSARLLMSLGEVTTARDNLNQSQQWWSKILAAEPNDLSGRIEASNLLNTLAATYPYGQEHVSCNLEAARLQSELLAQNPGNPELIKMLAMSWHNVGANYLTLKQFTEAEAYLEKSYQLLETSHASSIPLPNYSVEMAETEANLILANLSLQRPDKAEKYYLQSIERLERAAGEDPSNLRVLLSLCGLRVNRANMIKDQQAALTMLDTNVAALQALLQREPEFVAAKERLLETQGSRGNLLSMAKRHREAAIAFQDVVRYAADGDKDFYSLFVASNYAFLGEYRLSAEACEKAARYSQLNHEQKAYLALCHVCNANTVERDRSLSAEQQKALINKYQADAKQWLMQTRKSCTEQQWNLLTVAFAIDATWKPLRENTLIWDWLKTQRNHKL